MPLIVSDIKMPLHIEQDAVLEFVSNALNLQSGAILRMRIVRQSLDARKKQDIHFRISVEIELAPGDEKKLLKKGSAHIQAYEPIEAYALTQGSEALKGRIVIAGFGPAGLFAAYFLSLHGYKPLVVERGADVDAREKAVERFWSKGILDEESNVAFGEGGAGTFSDGKLTSRSKNPRSDIVLRTLHTHGAPEEILFKAKPHIGTDKLRAILKSMRGKIIEAGGEVLFLSKLADLEIQNGRLTRVHILKNGELIKLPCAACILATGHSARDTYRMLLKRGVMIAPKPFAVGVRIEHPQALINQAQYGALMAHPRLGAAEYQLKARSKDRGVYSFCMCPGGSVVAAASETEQVVINGMSYYARDAQNANSAIVVQVNPEDFGTAPLSGIEFQERLEKQAFLLGGGQYAAPAQLVGDFLKNRKSRAIRGVRPSYRPGIELRSLDDCLPDFVAEGIRDALPAFSRQLHGFDMHDAVLTAVESRTSAPARILRDALFQAVGIEGLYPAGEGAGYAGGIVSAAIDGMMAAEKIAARFSPDMHA